MATLYSSILAWKIPWTEGLPGYSPRGCKESDMTGHTHYIDQYLSHFKQGLPWSCSTDVGHYYEYSLKMVY